MMIRYCNAGAENLDNENDSLFSRRLPLTSSPAGRQETLHLDTPIK